MKWQTTSVGDFCLLGCSVTAEVLGKNTFEIGICDLGLVKMFALQGRDAADSARLVSRRKSTLDFAVTLKGACFSAGVKVLPRWLYSVRSKPFLDVIAHGISEIYIIRIDKTFFLEMAKEFGLFSRVGETEKIIYPIKYPAAYLEKIGAVMSRFQGKVPTGICQKVCEEVAFQLLRDLPLTTEGQPPFVESAKYRIFRNSESYMRQNLMSCLTMDDVCAAAGVSPSYVNVAFNELTHMSPKAFFRALQMNDARRQILTGSVRSVGELSERYAITSGGFTDCYARHFFELPSDTLHNSAAKIKDSLPASTIPA